MIILISNFTKQDKLDLESANKYLLAFIDERFGKILKLKETSDKYETMLVNSFTAANSSNSDDHAPHALALIVKVTDDFTQFHIIQAAKQFERKTMSDFIPEEWNLQKEPLVELIKILTTFNMNDKEKNPMEGTEIHFNMIQDIKYNILEYIGNKEMSLKWSEAENGIRYEIYSKESLLAYVMVKVVKEDNKFYLSVLIKLSIKDAEEKTFLIPMIEEYENTFHEPMNKIIQELRFDEYFNNNDENFYEIKQFFSKNAQFKFEEIKIHPENKDEQIQRKFILSFENYAVEGRVSYNKPTHHLASATYSLEFNNDEVDIPESKYNRMKRSELRSLLNSLNLANYFKSVKEIILTIFEEECKKHYNPKLGEVNFGKSTFWIATGIKIQARYGNYTAAELTYKESYGKVNVQIDTFIGYKAMSAHAFEKNQFEKTTIEEFIRFSILKGSRGYIVKEDLQML